MKLSRSLWIRLIVPAFCWLLVWPAALQAGEANRQPLRLVYADWSSSVASAHLVCYLVRHHLDRPCDLKQVSVGEMYRQVASGEADAMLSAWLPDTHRSYIQQYGDQLRDLGPNFEGTRIGLVVPAVRQGRQTGPRGEQGRDDLAVKSIADLEQHARAFGGRIIGIQADTGIMLATRRAMKAYGLDKFRLVAGTEASMGEALQNAIQRNQPIVVTGWRPHWQFGRWSLRFLDDPKNIYGHNGSIHTLVHPGLKQTMPRVVALLDRFHWNSDELGQLMVWIKEDRAHDPDAQVERWLRTHPEQISNWLSTDKK